MTELESAKKGIATKLARLISHKEQVRLKKLTSLIGSGKVVIPANSNHQLKKPCAIGMGLSTKVNANIGTSTDESDLDDEMRKLACAIECGADTVMDLSVAGNLKEMRSWILERSSVPVGTVPVYEIAVNAQKNNKDMLDFNAGDILRVLEGQAEEGVDFFTIHAGVTRSSLAALAKKKRVMGIVSRGGSILAAWIKRHKKENPFYEYFDEILDIAYKYDVTLSLGDGLRPGSVLDATDSGQVKELEILGQLSKRAYRKNVQVMIEGPGHVPLGQIKKNIMLQKKICRQAPFYVLGPLVTDVSAGYDHISASIGGALAASFGADFLCFVTASEHLRHPLVEDVREAVIASRIAAHAADLVKFPDRAISWDRDISVARRQRDWKRQIGLAIDPERARRLRESSLPKDPGVCTMCGEFCSIKLTDECVRV